jgi:hypothetical protein
MDNVEINFDLIVDYFLEYNMLYSVGKILIITSISLMNWGCGSNSGAPALQV